MSIVRIPALNGQAMCLPYINKIFYTVFNFLRSTTYDLIGQEQIDNKGNTHSYRSYHYDQQGNPMKYIDPTGMEKIIVSGGVTQEDYKEGGGRYEKYKYQFIETSVKDIKVHKERELLKAWKESGLPDLNQMARSKGLEFDMKMMEVIVADKYDKEEISWMVVNYGYTNDEIEKFRDTAKGLGVNFVLINSKNDFINYINTKNVDGDGSGRVKDKITYFASNSHGLKGTLAWGYNSSSAKRYQEGRRLNFLQSDIRKLDKQAFSKNIYSISYACNTGTEYNGSSFAQEWVNWSGGEIKAVVDGTAYYEKINFTSDFAQKLEAKLNRFINGFSTIGSANLPVNSEGVHWRIFNPQ